MMRTAIRILALASALSSPAAAERGLAKALKTRSAQLCLYDLNEAGTDPSGPTAGTVVFNSNVYDCASYNADPQFDEPVYSRLLGEIGISCTWATTSGDDQLVPCSGAITLMSSPKMKASKPLSSAVVSFWVTAGELGNSDLSNLVAPIVVRSTGSWPKPDAFEGYSVTVDAAMEQIYLNIEYRKNGWNPASTSTK